MTDYDKLTVANLRVILKERGIVSTGLTRKVQIIQKLQEDDAENQAAPSAKEPALEAQESPAVEEPELEDVTVEDAPTKPPSPPPTEPEAAPVSESADRRKLQNQALPTTETDAEVAAAIITTQASATETAASSQLNSDVESYKKRKRRSASPSLETQDLFKRAKVLQAHVHLKEDDDFKEEVKKPAPQVELPDAKDEPKLDSLSKEEPVSKESIKPVPDKEPEIESKPSIHPPTRALYIRNFTRPLQPTALRRHLTSLTSSGNGDPVELLHLDSIRTHAFVVFDSVKSAQKARNAIHERVWPDERHRKALWADFIPVEKVKGWIDTENEAGRGMTRWEVDYSGQGDDVTVELREEGVPSKKARTEPTKPKGITAPLEDVQIPPDRQEARPPTESFATLDSLFKNTAAKPMLYYKPVSESLASSRLEELRDATSDRWSSSYRDRERAPPRGSGEREEDEVQHRYTFEDGDKLVDGGVHRFGKRARDNEIARIGGGHGVPTGPRAGGGRPGGRRGGGGFGRRWR